MAKFAKDVANNTDRTEIACSDDKVEKESQTAVTTSSITVKKKKNSLSHSHRVDI